MSGNTNPHRKVPTQKALARFLAKRGNAGMVGPFQIPRMKLGSLPDLPEGRV
ncbi:hypothetical protein [Alteromonas gracilis]|uniref:hypothetical protein n=1 Tax=Alteromonas gracilis TaxID=1479524 RepID=UPI002FE1CF76